MNVRRRVANPKAAIGPNVANTATTRKEMPTQAKEIKNTVSCPKAKGYSKIKGTNTGSK